MYSATPRCSRHTLEKSKVLEVRDLHVSYGPVEALRKASIEVYEGEIVVLLGGNGAGKTTLLESVLGLTPRKSGGVFFLNRNITSLKTDHIVALGICLVPEGRGILPNMTVLENLQLGAYHYKGNVKDRLELVYEHFPMLKERSRQEAGTLSGGEQQMLSIGTGLMSEPKLMMLDEPSLGLAPVIINDLFEIIASLNRSGYSILLSEQNARMALRYAHRGYVFETGEVVLSGSVGQLRSNDRVREAYLGNVL
jgi:branched-chain amino acid transport system ATP-binding protein